MTNKKYKTVHDEGTLRALEAIDRLDKTGSIFWDEQRTDLIKFSEKREKEAILLARNMKGIELEKIGKVDEAIELYEKNIEENFEGNHPYDRLSTIYRKNKDILNEIRVLEKAIYVFENIVYAQRGDRLPKLEKFRTRLEKAKKLL